MCNRDCPCNENCPNGCAGCDNEACYCDAATNEDAKECFAYWERVLNDCLEACNPEDEESLSVCFCFLT